MAQEPDLSWRKRAACRGLSPSLFVLDKGTPPAKGKKVCSTCTVKEPCLEFGKASGESGIWGGEVLKGTTTTVEVVIWDTPRVVQTGRPKRSRRNIT